MSKEQRIVQIVISIICIILICAHLFLPQLQIDTIILVLLIVGILPWTASLIKSIDVPGIGKVEFQASLENAKKELKKGGLLAELPKSNVEQIYSFETVLDPALALTGLRIELERTLRELLTKSGESQLKTLGSIRYLAEQLLKKGVLSQSQVNVLADLSGTLNSAAHGGDIHQSAREWALEVGPKLLNNLKQKNKPY